MAHTFRCIGVLGYTYFANRFANFQLVAFRFSAGRSALGFGMHIVRPPFRGLSVGGVFVF